MSLFAPQQDGFSRREVVYRAIRDRSTGELIPYSELPYDREVVIRLRTGVAKLMEREQQRTVLCVPDEGWRIVSGADHITVAQRTRRQATRRLGRAVELAQTVDRRDLSAQDQLRADAELINATTGYGVLRGLAQRRLGVGDVRAWRDRKGAS